jgi:hypothetical protein
MVQRHTRPIAAFQQPFRMLPCGPSNRTFVHFAAFLLAETSVCGAVSTGRCNTGIKFLCWCLVLQGLSWSLV